MRPFRASLTVVAALAFLCGCTSFEIEDVPILEKPIDVSASLDYEEHFFEEEFNSLIKKARSEYYLGDGVWKNDMGYGDGGCAVLHGALLFYRAGVEHDLGHYVDIARGCSDRAYRLLSESRMEFILLKRRFIPFLAFPSMIVALEYEDRPDYVKQIEKTLGKSDGYIRLFFGQVNKYSGFFAPMAGYGNILYYLRTHDKADAVRGINYLLQTDRRYWSKNGVTNRWRYQGKGVGLKLDEANEITHVKKDTPAARARLKKGDKVIRVEYDEKQLAPQALTRERAAYDAFKVIFEREGEEKTTYIGLTERAGGFALSLNMAALANAYRVTGDARWLDYAKEIRDHFEQTRWDAGGGGYFDDLFFGGKTLSSNNNVAWAYLDLYEVTGDKWYLDKAVEITRSVYGIFYDRKSGMLLHDTWAIEKGETRLCSGCTLLFLYNVYRINDGTLNIH